MYVAAMRPAHLLLLLSIPALAACSTDPCGSAVPPAVAADHILLRPDSPELGLAPPDSFDVVLETSAGALHVRVYREWGPLGATRFYNLVQHGFYDGSRFFRVLPGFAAQFGMSGRPAIDSVWAQRRLPDEPPRVRTDRGTLSYAMAGPDSRTTQLFFSYRGNETLDAQGFAPIGRVVDGLEVLYRLHGDYGEVAPEGNGPAFGCIASHGNAYLGARFPELDSIATARVLAP
jgi:peptidyl-prolyl cis-trans isomerase A (cyclophilin A)